MKTLFTGPLNNFRTTKFIHDALIILGFELHTLNQLLYFDDNNSILKKIETRLLFGPNIINYNRDIVQAVKEFRPDFVFVDQAYYLWAKTLEEIKTFNVKIIHYTTESLLFKKQHYRHFFNAAKFYDYHVITNTLNISPLKEIGAKKIIRTHLGYVPEIYKPPLLTQEDITMHKSDVVFVGHWEPTTEKIISELRKNGIAVKVWGTSWKYAKSLDDRKDISPIYGMDYLKALSTAKICLGILSKWNKNQSAGRTFEIPALGSFLLAERTDDHKSYFEEDKEAIYFSSTNELIDKIRYYLKHEDKRNTIAKAGHLRCITSKYTYVDRIKEVMNEIVNDL